MGLTIYFMIAFIASANAGFVWSSSGTGNSDKFPAFPQFPKLTFPTFPSFPTFPTFPSIVMPSKKDIMNNDNPNFSGSFISSSSSSSIGADGKVRKTGGTTIVTNDNGVVKEYTIGNNPRDSDESQPEIIVPQIQFWQPLVHLIPDDQLLKPYKPTDKNQHFYGTSSTSFIHSSNVNGVRNEFGGTNIISNIDGVVSEKSSHIQANDN